MRLPQKKKWEVSTSQSPKINSKVHTLLLTNNSSQSLKDIKSKLKKSLKPWQLNKITHKRNSYQFESPQGPFTLVVIDEETKSTEHYGLFQQNDFAQGRDTIGQIVRGINQDEIWIQGFHLSPSSWKGVILGIELAQFSYKNTKSKKIKLFSNQKDLKPLNTLLKETQTLAQSVNLARVMVDTPPGEKQPGDYAQFVKGLFDKKQNTKVNIWNEKKLQKENMGMMLGVGKGANQKPHLVHLNYRPKNPINKKPLAFVGKGITFDSGGLDIKPASGMRNMKKDMGGSASILGLAHWIVETRQPIQCDFYLALAENAVSAESFRPGDILMARNGLKVEIDNTDAEGRLVLGDALTVATEKKPELVIDVATLTGAIKVALGSETAGMFSNSDQLSHDLLNAAAAVSEPIWRMPLLKEQRTKLSSPVADLTNSSSGFGGAVRAAMFLKEFIGDTPWAHFDIYSWIDSPRGAYGHTGGNGQLVQTLTKFIDSYKELKS